MKAHKGEEIICKCAQPAGIFRRDIDALDSISSDDFEISRGVTEDHVRWVCPTCKATVAQLSCDHYGVMTRKGWRE